MKLRLRPSCPFQLGCRYRINRCHELTSTINPGSLAQRAFRLPTTICKRAFATAIGNHESISTKASSTNAWIKGKPPYLDKISAYELQDNQDAAAWIQQLEPYLPPALRGEASKEFSTPFTAETDKTPTHSSYEGAEIATILHHARLLADLDLLAYLGFTLRRWPAVSVLITKMLDATDGLQKTSNLFQAPPSNLIWRSGDIKYITSETQARSDEPIVSGFDSGTKAISMEQLTDEPRDQLTTLGIMGEVWQSLGFIVVVAADKTMHESQLAMSYVYQALARLHHSGIISDALYKFSKRPDDGVLFRPPGMHLLSVHIMNVLSDAAWLVHEAEATAKAEAAGEESPYRPFKMGIRHLGPEIWLEFILWSCIEQGHVQEGVWILKHLQGRKYGAAWKIVSWNPLLDHPELFTETNIDTHDFWPHPDIQRTAEEAKNNSGFFHGIGRRTISAEVVTALAMNATNSVDLNGSLGGSGVRDVVGLLAFLNSMKESHSDGKATRLSTACRQIVQVLESHNFRPKVEPEWLERMINALPPPLAPWDDSVPRDYQQLTALDRHEIYSTSSMLTGLLQQDLRLYASDRQIESAIKVFASLLKSIDASKMQRIQEFLVKEKDKVKDNEQESKTMSDFDALPEASVQIDQSSVPTLSNGTLADLLDLITICKANEFGEWLLFSGDVDGPAISLQSFADQSLTPSILRFAAATQNRELGNLVVQQLKPPISRNTFNALANCHMAFNQWDEAEEILNLLRHRRKAWGDSTLASLSAAILRLEQKIWENPQDKQSEDSLLRAEDMLRRIFLGHYNPMASFDENVDLHYKRACYRWHEMLSSIPGVLARTCGEVQLKYTNPLRRDTLPYIPSVAFNVLLDATAEIRGSMAGMELWKRWCIDLERSHAPRLVEDDTYRLETSADPSTELIAFDFEFDWAWFREKQWKAVVPNLNTLRIITRAAVKELRELREFKEASKSQSYISTSMKQSEEDTYKVLDFCVERYRRFDKDDADINRETNGHLQAMETIEKEKAKSGTTRLIQWVDMDVHQEKNTAGLIVKKEGDYQR